MIAKLRTFLLSSEPILPLTDDNGLSITYDRKTVAVDSQKVFVEIQNV